MADIIIVLSEEWAKFFGENICDLEKIVILYNGVIIPKYCKKDYTDTMIAVMEAIKLGYTDIRIYGGTGGRADHTFANIQTLLYGAKKGADMRMVDSDRVYNVINDSKIILKNRICVNLSIFALGDKAEGVSILGAKYELKDGTLTNDYPLAVSNTFVGNDVSIEVKKGALLIIYDR